MTRTCSQPKCDNPYYARGLCNKHYQRLTKTGTLQATKRVAPKGLSPYEVVCFHGWTRRLVHAHLGPCWEWRGPREQAGYGAFRVNKRSYKAHRVVLEHKIGPMSPATATRHKCDNRCCVNPDHLESGSWGDNNRDRDKRGRSGAAKIDVVTANRIRNEYVPGTTTLAFLAGKYGLSFQQVSRIVRREAWNYCGD